jgi:hypothetical protein
MPERTHPQPDLSDVLIDVEVIRLKLAHLSNRVALAVPRPRRGYCTRLVAVLADTVDLLDDMAAGLSGSYCSTCSPASSDGCWAATNPTSSPRRSKTPWSCASAASRSPAGDKRACPESRGDGLGNH